MKKLSKDKADNKSKTFLAAEKLAGQNNQPNQSGDKENEKIKNSQTDERSSTVPEKEQPKKEKRKEQVTLYFHDENADRIEKIRKTFKNMTNGKVVNSLALYMLESYDDKKLQEIVKKQILKDFL